ncbi:MAG: OmpA family protein [Bacteroidota bacterium]
MKRSTWRILAISALMGAVALPASAQVVIGGSGTPSVEVNWSVLDKLGRQPTLADMLKTGVPGAENRAEVSQPQSKGVQYRPYKAGAKPYTKPAKATHAAPKPKKSHVVPASAKTERMADLVQKSAEPAKTPVAEAPKLAAPAIVGPQIALPEVPKPAAATAPVQLAKADPAPAPVAEPKVEPKAEPKVEAKADPVALPPTALTPPPMPVAKVEAPKVEVPPQIASLPSTPAPTPAPAAASHGGDTLSVPFAAESARLPDNVHADLDRLVKRMQKDDSLGLQLLAYAEGDDVNASKARRLSLSRALEVRKYLMEQGLRSTRIEVRALGNKLEGGGPADRVDAVLVGR